MMQRASRVVKFAVVGMMIVGGCVTAAPDWGAFRRDHVAELGPGVTREERAAILRGEVLVGMTPQEGMLAWVDWGPPYDVNRTTTEAGTREQWVFERGRGTARYDTRYFYVEDGVIVAVQN